MKDLRSGHAKLVKNAAGHQARASDAGAAMNDHGFALNQLGVHFINKRGKRLR